MASHLRALALSAAGVLALSACTTAAPTQAPVGNAPSQVATSSVPAATNAEPSAAAPSTGADGARAPQKTYRAADGSCELPEKVLGKDHENLMTTEKKIALTFDGGAAIKGFDRILDTLAEKQATASFFFTGQFAERNPELVKRAAAKYPVGNHSWNHPGFASKKLSNAEITSQLERAEKAIEQAGGVNPAPFFRYPEGDRSAATTVQVNKNCYVPIRWSIDTRGWVGSKGSGNIPGQSRASVLKSVLDAPAEKKNGGIVLMHVGEATGDGSTFDADALPDMIDGLRAQGYELVTLEQLFA